MSEVTLSYPSGRSETKNFPALVNVAKFNDDDLGLLARSPGCRGTSSCELIPRSFVRDCQVVGATNGRLSVQLSQIARL